MVDPSLCTHILYAFAALDNDTLLITESSKKIAKFQGMYEKVTSLKSFGPKVLLSMGGWREGTEKYSRLVSSAEARRSFVHHVVGYLRENNFDGLDVDWSYPVCWQNNCAAGPETDKSNYVLWIKELREALVKNNMTLVASLSTLRYGTKYLFPQ